MGYSKNSFLVSTLLHALILIGLVLALKHDVIYSMASNKINAQQVYLVIKTEIQSQVQKASPPTHATTLALTNIQTHTAPMFRKDLLIASSAAQRGLSEQAVSPGQTLEQYQTQAQTHPNTAASIHAGAAQPASTPLSSSQIQQLLLIISADIQHNLHYPSWAVTHVAQGQSLLQFQLNTQGDLQNIQLIQSSGTTRLDQAAVQAILASSPVAIPNSIKLAETMTFRLPVHFNMQT